MAYRRSNFPMQISLLIAPLAWPARHPAPSGARAHGVAMGSRTSPRMVQKIPVAVRSIAEAFSRNGATVLTW